MTAHDHADYHEGCFRCELSRDEVESAMEFEISDLEAEVERLRELIVDLPCDCLPHALPNDGMCQRCMALRGAA